MTETSIDVLIVGAGPAGVSAAWPLVKAGLRVTMVDGGTPIADGPEFPSLNALLAHREEAWKWLLSRTSYTDPHALISPKLRIPKLAVPLARYREACSVALERFNLYGLMVPGGMSVAWGAGAAAFTDDEMRDFPFDRATLAPSYLAVAKRIGLSGRADDDIAAWAGDDLPLSPPLDRYPKVDKLFNRYRTERDQITGLGFRLGAVRQAVLSVDLGDRLACAQTNLCFTGCARRSIYNAQYELDALGRSGAFTFRPGQLVVALKRIDDNGFEVVVKDGHTGSHQRLKASRVALAAGTICSTILALQAQRQTTATIPVQTTPILGYALFLPDCLGAVAEPRGYAMAQAMFSLAHRFGEQEEKLCGYLFSTEGMPASEFAARLPFGRATSLAMARLIWPSLLLGTCFFSGRASDNRLHLTTVNGRSEVSIVGGFSDFLKPAAAEITQKLRRVFALLGASMVPFAVKFSQPGADLHYAATLPMSARPGPGQTDSLGQLPGWEGLHLVDGAVLSSLPAKPHTLTIMANADRIARRIATEFPYRQR